MILATDFWLLCDKGYQIDDPDSKLAPSLLTRYDSDGESVEVDTLDKRFYHDSITNNSTMIIVK